MKLLIILFQLIPFSCFSQDIIVTVSDKLLLNVTSNDVELKLYRLNEGVRSSQPKFVFEKEDFENYCVKKGIKFEYLKSEEIETSKTITQSYLLREVNEETFNLIKEKLYEKYYLKFKAIDCKIENEDHSITELYNMLLKEATSKASKIASTIQKELGVIKEIRLNSLGQFDANRAGDLFQYKKRFVGAEYEITFETKN